MWTDRQMDRRTDTKKLIIAFRNFAKGSKNVTINHKHRAAVLTFLCCRPLSVYSEPYGPRHSKMCLNATMKHIDV